MLFGKPVSNNWICGYLVKVVYEIFAFWCTLVFEIDSWKDCPYLQENQKFPVIRVISIFKQQFHKCGFLSLHTVLKHSLHHCGYHSPVAD